MTKKEWVTVPCPKSTVREVVQEESSLSSFKGKKHGSSIVWLKSRTLAERYKVSPNTCSECKQEVS